MYIDVYYVLFFLLNNIHVKFNKMTIKDNLTLCSHVLVFFLDGKSLSLGPSVSGGGMMLPDGTDLRQVTVLSKQDWERIECELNRKNIQDEMVRKIREDREEQKRKSKEIIKNWGNTIAVSYSTVCDHMSDCFSLIC